MKNQSKDKTTIDSRLKQLDKDMNWKKDRKNNLEEDILLTIDRNRHKTRLLAGFKYSLSIAVLVTLLFFGYHFFSDSFTYQDKESTTGNQQSETNHLLVDKELAEKEGMEEARVEQEEMNLGIETRPAETVIRGVEGMEQEVRVIGYEIQPYGISYQLDEVFGAPVVDGDQVIHSIESDYEITFEIIEGTKLEEAIANLQTRFETEGYEEKFELEETPLEENTLKGNMQFFGYEPVKGFIAYDLDEHVLVITFQYPEVAGDGMYPLLEGLRKSIQVR